MIFWTYSIGGSTAFTGCVAGQGHETTASGVDQAQEHHWQWLWSYADVPLAPLPLLLHLWLEGGQFQWFGINSLHQDLVNLWANEVRTISEDYPTGFSQTISFSWWICFSSSLSAALGIPAARSIAMSKKPSLAWPMDPGRHWVFQKKTGCE